MDRLEVKAEIEIDDAGTVTGLAWPWSPDQVGDEIERGAFSFPAALPIVIEHNERDVVGVWESLTETDAGLEVKGRLFVEGIKPAREARTRLQTNQMKGLSIGFSWKECEQLPSGGRRFKSVHITEISLCRRPVHPGARVTAIKSMNKESDQMENEVHAPAIETKADPVVDQKTVDAMKARLDKLEAKANRPVASNNNHPAAVNDNGSDEVKAFASFLRSEYRQLSGEEQKALTVATDMAAGSVLAPEETSREFIRNLVEFSPVRSIADVRSTGSHTVTLPKRLTVTNAKWKGEAVTSEASEPSFGDMDIVIKEMTTHVDVGMWLIEDAINDVEGEVRLALAEDFGAKEGLSFVSGSLAVEPEGFMTNADVAQVLNGHASVIAPDQLISMMYSLPAAYRNVGTFVMNGTTLAAIRKLKDGQGNYLWQPAYAAGQPETILGRRWSS